MNGLNECILLDHILMLPMLECVKEKDSHETLQE